LRETRKVRAGQAYHARRPHTGGQAVRYPDEELTGERVQTLQPTRLSLQFRRKTWNPAVFSL